MASISEQIGEGLAELINSLSGVTEADGSLTPWILENWVATFAWRPQIPSQQTVDPLVYVTPVDYEFDSAERDRCGCPRIWEHHVVVLDKPPKDLSGVEYVDPERMSDVVGLSEQIAKAVCGLSLPGIAHEAAEPAPAPLFNEFYLEEHRIIISSHAFFYRI